MSLPLITHYSSLITLFTRLARLELQLHVGVAHALALVGVGLAEVVHLGGDLSELLLVNAGERQRQLVLLYRALGRDALALHLDAFGQGELYRVRVAQREDDLLALHVRLVADADHVHFLREPFGHADDGVVGERAGEAARRAPVVRRTLGLQPVAFELERDAFGDRRPQSPLRPLHLELAVVDRHRDVLRNRDSLFTNARHNKPQWSVAGGRWPAGGLNWPPATDHWPLVDFCQDLAADVLAACALARHQAARGRDDVDAVAAQDFRYLARAHVDAPSGRRDAREVRDRARPARVVAQEDADRPLHALALRDEVIDVALFLQDAGDLQLQLRRRDVNARVLRRDRVAHPRQHVGNRISHYSNSKTVLSSEFSVFSRPSFSTALQRVSGFD